MADEPKKKGKTKGTTIALAVVAVVGAYYLYKKYAGGSSSSATAAPDASGTAGVPYGSDDSGSGGGGGGGSPSGSAGTPSSSVATGTSTATGTDYAGTGTTGYTGGTSFVDESTARGTLEFPALAGATAAVEALPSSTNGTTTPAGVRPGTTRAGTVKI